MIDTLISGMRPLTLKGKQFVLDYVTPHNGAHLAKVAGTYFTTPDLANATHRQIYMGCLANAMTRWTRSLLHTGGKFPDVCAHAGSFSLIAADRVGRDGRVIAIEPNPVVFSALPAHATSNGIAQAEACNRGLAQREGSVALSDSHAESVRYYNSTLPRRPGWTAIETAVRRLDDCLDDWGVKRIDLMKTDVEGAEPRVLAGAAHLASGVARQAMIEINGPRLVEAGSSPTAIVEDLTALGFEPARLVTGRAVRVARTDIDLDPVHERDCLFVHWATLQAETTDEDMP